ncbi:hypothetical protein HYT23_05950 [Candidatus Pacearchaeota archaeon]|nr:hypothetical protein [Candidatus Pacearchaeota archaeon]
MKIGDKEKNPRFFYPSFSPKTRQGQFYMLAAVILIGIVLSFIATANYSRKAETTKVYDLKKELETESARELDRGALSGTYNLDEFTQNFSSHAGSGVDIIYITADVSSGIVSNLQVYRYEYDVKLTDVVFSKNAGVVNVNWGGSNYYYKLREGKNFYFLVSQYIGGEKYVARN